MELLYSYSLLLARFNQRINKVVCFARVADNNHRKTSLILIKKFGIAHGTRSDTRVLWFNHQKTTPKQSDTVNNKHLFKLFKL